MNELEFREFATPEKSRTYHFKDGTSFKIEKVCAICVRPSGGHRIETVDGKKFIINANWVAIEIDTPTWSI